MSSSIAEVSQSPPELSNTFNLFDHTQSMKESKEEHQQSFMKFAVSDVAMPSNMATAS